MSAQAASNAAFALTGSRKHTHSDSSGSSDVGCCDAGSAAETPAAPVHSSKKARKRAPAENLDGLVDQLLELFEGDEADVDEVKAAMAAYTPDREDWCKYEHWDNHKYTRNLVHKGNGKFNLIMLCWNTGQASSIHDHAGAHCFMKLMHGKLQEDLYPCDEHVKEGEPMVPCQTCEAVEGDVCYISDEVGLHRVSNPSHTEGAVSLHLYSPPFQFCKSYCDRQGIARKSGAMTFHSEYGTKCTFGDKQKVIKERAAAKEESK